MYFSIPCKIFQNEDKKDRNQFLDILNSSLKFCKLVFDDSCSQCHPFPNYTEFLTMILTKDYYADKSRRFEVTSDYKQDDGYSTTFLHQNKDILLTIAFTQWLR